MLPYRRNAFFGGNRLNSRTGIAGPASATASLNPWTEVKVDTEDPYRGPLMIISGEKDDTAPRAIADAAYRQQQKNTGISGRLEVCQTALTFVERFSER